MVDFYRSDLSAEVRRKIEEHAVSYNQIPGIVVIYDTENWSVVYMSKRGLKSLELTLAEIHSLAPHEYHSRYFSMQNKVIPFPAMDEIVRGGRDAPLSFCQQMRFGMQKKWTWCLSSIYPLLIDEAGNTTFAIAVSLPIDEMHQLTTKAERMVDDTDFLQHHEASFLKLSKREIAILKEVALGKSSAQIGEELYIAPSTVDTHRRNIRRKLNAKSKYEISKYARAFDLI